MVVVVVDPVEPCPAERAYKSNLCLCVLLLNLVIIMVDICEQSPEMFKLEFTLIRIPLNPPCQEENAIRQQSSRWRLIATHSRNYHFSNFMTVKAEHKIALVFRLGVFTQPASTKKKHFCHNGQGSFVRTTLIFWRWPFVINLPSLTVTNRKKLAIFVPM